VAICNSIRSPGAIALGAFFASVTGYVLCKDVIDGSAVTTNHVLSLAALVAAIATGHMAIPQLKAKRTLGPDPCADIYRQHHLYHHQQRRSKCRHGLHQGRSHRAGQTDRVRIEERLETAQEMLDKEIAEVRCQCDGKGRKEDQCPKAGSGPRCAVAREAVKTYTDAVEDVEARLAKMRLKCIKCLNCIKCTSVASA
jgi:hypothetical protein